jgi:hypothetical protein
MMDGVQMMGLETRLERSTHEEPKLRVWVRASRCTGRNCVAAGGKRDESAGDFGKDCACQIH